MRCPSAANAGGTRRGGHHPQPVAQHRNHTTAGPPASQPARPPAAAAAALHPRRPRPRPHRAPPTSRPCPAPPRFRLGHPGTAPACSADPARPRPSHASAPPHALQASPSRHGSGTAPPPVPIPRRASHFRPLSCEFQASPAPSRTEKRIPEGLPRPHGLLPGQEQPAAAKLPILPKSRDNFWVLSWVKQIGREGAESRP